MYKGYTCTCTYVHHLPVIHLGSWARPEGISVDPLLKSDPVNGDTL